MSSTITTYEVNLTAATEAEIRLANIKSIQVRKEPFTLSCWPRDGAVVFATAKLSSDRYEQLAACLLPDQTLIAPRWLFEREYDEFKEAEAFRELYPSFQDYISKTDYLALSSTTIIGDQLIEHIICYDVNFVDFHTDVFSDQGDISSFYQSLAAQVGF